jgi:hypothetical protein
MSGAIAQAMVAEGMQLMRHEYQSSASRDMTTGNPEPAMQGMLMPFVRTVWCRRVAIETPARDATVDTRRRALHPAPQLRRKASQGFTPRLVRHR